MEPLTFALIVFELVLMVLSISLHDMAQAWTADKLGDPTAKMLGRITINPVRHFDAWGMAAMPLLDLLLYHALVPFGWGAPVPMTYRNFRDKNGETKAVLAGPAMQLGVAVLSLVLLIVLKHTLQDGRELVVVAAAVAQRYPLPFDLAGMPTVFPLLLLLYLSVMMNLFLLIVNLLPMPFFDGGKLLANHLPYNAARAFEQNSMLFTIAFFFLAYPLTMMVFGPLMSAFTRVLLVM